MKMGVYEKTGFVLILLMACLQGFYAAYAYIDPAAFSVIRGTELVAGGDADWVRIYASRTLFVALVVGYLLYLRSYAILKWVALIGLAMPVTDAVLAHYAAAPISVVMKHLATAIYLLVTFCVLRAAVREQDSAANQG